jgi:hypothetical protein
MVKEIIGETYMSRMVEHVEVKAIYPSLHELLDWRLGLW